MKRALINIDYTNDFVAVDGTLTCGETGQAIEERVIGITKEFIQNNDAVFFTIDIHNEDDLYHPETKLFPPHNIEGTLGRKLFGGLENIYQSNKNHNNVFWIDKTRYSAFQGTDLELKLRERGIEELHLVGVCTDICVLHTAVDAYNKGFQIVIHEDAVASFDSAGHHWAIRHFAGTLGAVILRNGGIV
ncbi:cysteine hydrolase [Neobacillus mesonae]|nr:cysteine hydrolase [Neobacillus mesonae]